MTGDRVSWEEREEEVNERRSDEQENEA